jgi:polyhydroxybutyrate depolymerase
MAGGGMSMGGALAGAGMGGTPALGGAGMGGASGGAGGKGGAGGGGGKAPADPSGGCGKANPQIGSSGSPLTVSGHQYYVKLPTGYDASKPYPVLFMFNPTNNPINWAEQNAGFEQNGAKDAWIRVYPHPANSSAGWGSGDVSFFAPLYNSITTNFCVDRERMFAAGESSGGDFSSILGCEHADKLRAIGPCATKPVNNYPLDATRRTCTGQVAAVIIHGKNDTEVGPANGPLTRDFYRALNHCTSMSQPVTGYTDSLSNCVEFQGCDSGYPLYWCQHSDPEYGNTNHGWPRFAAKFLWEKFSAY